MKKKLASAALAVSSLAGVGATTLATAPSANASTPHRYQHNATHYSTQRDCQATYRGVVNRITHGSLGFVIGHGNPKCSYQSWYPILHRSGGYWTYGHVSYVAYGPKISGDFRY